MINDSFVQVAINKLVHVKVLLLYLAGYKEIVFVPK